MRWILTLDETGKLIGTGPLETEGVKKKGKEFECPQSSGSKTGGGKAEFLADGITSVFGLDTAPDESMPDKKRKDRDENNRRKYDDFWNQIERATKAKAHPALIGLMAFKPDPSKPPAFLRWGFSAKAKLNEKAAWWVTKSDGKEVKIGPDNFTFRVGETLLLEEETAVRSFWRDDFAKKNGVAEADAPRGLCLVTGENRQPLALTHDQKIKSPILQSFGASIVSFEEDAFASYGFKRSLNASTSIRAATGYATALNTMLSRDDHSIRLGRAVCCFWTRNQTVSTGGWGALLSQADPKAVADFLKAPLVGHEPESLHQEDFFAVTLAGNAGRIMVRHWFQDTMERASENIKQWFGDLDLERARLPTGKERLPPRALLSLACTTVRDDPEERLEVAAKLLRPEVTPQLFRAALEGTTPSLTLLYPILNRLRVDMARDGSKAITNHSRFALAKLILNRNRKKNIMTIEQQQTPDSQDAAYQCGRLLAVLAEAQSKAHDYPRDFAGISERYFGTAMASPASVFPLILKLNRHHLNKIRKSDKYRGHDRFLDEAIQDIFVKIDDFPRALDLHAQGRFAIGFYQQKASDRVAREAVKTKKQKEDNNN